eukprot:2480604-Rhodomonas_salina.1
MMPQFFERLVAALTMSELGIPSRMLWSLWECYQTASAALLSCRGKKESTTPSPMTAFSSEWPGPASPW